MTGHAIVRASAPIRFQRLAPRLLSLGIDLIYIVLLIVIIPWLAFLILARRRGVGSLGERLGNIQLPEPASASKRVWVHAVSVGELEAALPLIERLDARDNVEVVISTTTTTARAVAAKKCAGMRVFLFPIDFGPCVRRALRCVRPAAIVLMELELWPNLVLNADAAGIPLAIANGRVSQRGHRRMSRFGPLFRPFFSRLTRVLVQNRDYRDRVISLGASPDRVEITGNLKFDRAVIENPEEVRREFEERWGYAPGAPRWIAGCTHPGEEEKILAVHRSLRATCPGLSLILVPRHVERSAEVVELARGKGFDVVLHESGSDGVSGADVLVVDVTGELSRLYACADVAFVGGSLVPRGGHNLLEPVLAATPAVHGPFTANFSEIVKLLTGGEATFEAKHAEALERQVRAWLADPEQRKKRAARGMEILERHRGAAARSSERILDLLAL